MTTRYENSVGETKTCFNATFVEAGDTRISKSGKHSYSLLKFKKADGELIFTPLVLTSVSATVASMADQHLLYIQPNGQATLEHRTVELEGKSYSTYATTKYQRRLG